MFRVLSSDFNEIYLMSLKTMGGICNFAGRVRRSDVVVAGEFSALGGGKSVMSSDCSNSNLFDVKAALTERIISVAIATFFLCVKGDELLLFDAAASLLISLKGLFKSVMVCCFASKLTLCKLRTRI